MRAILYTNVMVSALLSPDGIPARVVRAWLEERFTLVSHDLQLDELRDVTRRASIRPRIRPTVAGRLMNQITCLAEIFFRPEESKDAVFDNALEVERKLRSASHDGQGGVLRQIEQDASPNLGYFFRGTKIIRLAGFASPPPR